MASTCGVAGCDAVIPPYSAACTRHWRAMPKVFRDRIWAAYNPLGGLCKGDEWRAAVRAGCEAVARLERLRAAQKPAAPRVRLTAAPRCLSPR